MKPVRLHAFLFVLLTFLLLPGTAKSQCSSSIKSYSFDTLVSGTGNNSYNFTAPQFNPAKGTLLSVVIKTNVSEGYAFQAENLATSSTPVTIGVGRYDYIGSSVLTNAYYANGMQKNYGPYTLGAANATSGAGPDYMQKPAFAFLKSNNVINDSITGAVAGFMGSASLAFTYYPSTYSIIPANLSYSFTANDTTHFSITYYYCNTVVLASDVVAFTAEKENNSGVKLGWEVQNEETGKTYEIETGDDGKNFTYAGSVSSLPSADNTGRYTYHYEVKNSSTINYFRLKETDRYDNITYTEIKAVEMGRNAGSGFTVFPNPARDFIDIDFGAINGKNWRVDIFASHGALVQSNVFTTTGKVHIIFARKPAAGVYFIRATEQGTGKIRQSTFIVQ